MESIFLEEIIERNSIDAHLFIPFTLYRLQPLSTERSVLLEVILHNIQPGSSIGNQVNLRWRTDSKRFDRPPAQEHVITEWAACGIACVILPLYTPYRVLHVAQVGEHFDYWVGDDTHEYGMEVSGTLSGDPFRRQRIKVEQLLGNPYQVDGFVSVTDFQSRRTLLSFHYFFKQV